MCPNEQCIVEKCVWNQVQGSMVIKLKFVLVLNNHVLLLFYIYFKMILLLCLVYWYDVNQFSSEPFPTCYKRINMVVICGC